MTDLSAITGVSARNIRAYRERGLLDAPRRQGRAALYDDRHVAQLNAISQLLGQGFTSAHIAGFFTAIREGIDIADMLSLPREAFVTPSNSRDRHRSVGPARPE